MVNTVLTEIEESILISFGHAIFEFEDTLYKKFQHLTINIVLSKNEFVEQLENMEERGVVVSGIFLCRRCWAIGPEACDFQI